jgi:hypothetical protein
MKLARAEAKTKTKDRADAAPQACPGLGFC